MAIQKCTQQTTLLQRFYPVLRKCLFQLPAETSHTFALKALQAISLLGLKPVIAQTELNDPVEAFGLHFPNPVGLAAGLDKNGDYIDALGLLGFGFIEVGTVTPRPQSGNPKPRLFRLTQEEAIINRMGFNNKGVDHLVHQVARSRFRAAGGIVGINIGKNADTPLERANDDYLHCLERVYPVADYIVVNISSPNTPGLRTLQFGEHLDALLTALTSRQRALAQQQQRKVPLLLKIAPDMSDDEVTHLAKQLLTHKIEGVIATNTTASREGGLESPSANEQGGLSGKPLLSQSTAILRRVKEIVGDDMVVIGVGGIDSKVAATEKFAAGAQLIQLYSGFIYQGSGLIRDAVNAHQALQST